MSRTSVAARSTNTRDTELLIKNLRLLDLDEEFDWPNIKSTTFAASSVVRDQQERVHCAEWVLYKLFTLWSPTESANHLSELFPVLEPKQSKTLRAALYKYLSELKTKGIFHKDIVLRRTMLDDCKGPKFEELLSTFSTLVLHRLLAEDKHDNSVSKNLITCRQTYDKQHMLPLHLAYQISNTRTLRLREAYDKRWQKFGRSLRSQKDDLVQRQKSLDESLGQRKEKKLPQRTLERLRKHVEGNWKGDSAWVEILLRSDHHRPHKKLLERPFEEIWNHACDDTLYSVRPQKNDSLLQTLEQRVQQQNTRLERWKSIRENLVLQSQAMGLIAEEQSEEHSASLETDTPDEWTGTDSTASSGRHSHVRKFSQHVDQDPVMDIYVSASPTRNSNTSGNTNSYAIPPEPRLERSPSRKTITHGRTSSMGAQYDMPPPSKSPDRRSPSRRLDDLPEDSPPRHLGPQEVMAAQILSSVMEAEATPLKPKPLSLEERARMSMARMSPQKADPQPWSNTQHDRQPSPDKTTTNPITPDRIQSLAERTRQSMSLMSAQPKPRKSRVSRVSNTYPTNQFETPRKTSNFPPQTPVFDETMEELDAESVFKSRPKIAISPMVQPTPVSMSIDDAMMLDEHTS